jgi:hypothetical protein
MTYFTKERRKISVPSRRSSPVVFSGASRTERKTAMQQELNPTEVLAVLGVIGILALFAGLFMLGMVVGS